MRSQEEIKSAIESLDMVLMILIMGSKSTHSTSLESMTAANMTLNWIIGDPSGDGFGDMITKLGALRNSIMSGAILEATELLNNYIKEAGESTKKETTH